MITKIPMRKRKMNQIQTEAQLEENLIQRLVGLGYVHIKILNNDDLCINLKTQLEKHNKIKLGDHEFTRVLNQLDKGNVFDKAKILRGSKILIKKDNDKPLYLNLLNTEHWCQNQYQVTNQINMEGHYKNRYDVTLLINGLPLVHIELKRRGMELKEAFNQINRYQRHTFWAESGLYQYVQIFVISNGVNTKYYANNRNQDFKQTFFWMDKKNKSIKSLDAFADSFLERCHVSKMISQYTVLHHSNKIPMVLRSYQYYAVENILNRVQKGQKNGYIWHTTGSGKTLTSFKAAQVLIEQPHVEKVIFVVDRADLDYQTTKEFNHFSQGCVDGTDNTKTLVKQMGNNKKLIVTTIQKLNTAITRYDRSLEVIKDQRVIFIFDECHRSQFGDTHQRIVKFFNKAQMFGFTGTPILAENAIGKRTTADLFGECLHKYLIVNAIADENVLKFSVEYWGKLRRKNGTLIDDDVIGLDTKEFFNNPDRVENVVDWIIAHHERKTLKREFTAMFCVSSVEALIAYYDTFKRKKDKHDLRVVAIFTFTANEEDNAADGMIGDPDIVLEPDTPLNKQSREKLEECILDYNSMYTTNYSTRDNSFYDYYKDIGKRIKDRERRDFKEGDRIDILLIVNMFLTGFDAKKVNTLYVDKNLKYHGLIQAFSRTNRTLGQKKSHGNIVCFRNLKKKTDEAIALFSDEEAKEKVLLEPYEDYIDQYNKAVDRLLKIASTVESVDELVDENDQLKFVLAFREIIRLKNTLSSFTEFSENDLKFKHQTFENYKSKYLDIKDRIKSQTDSDKASILEEVDFDLELIQRDEINVAYILSLLAEFFRQEKSSDQEQQEEGRKKRETILDFLNTETQLRSKRELIEQFIDRYMSKITSEEDISEMFSKYWTEEKKKAAKNICSTEGLDDNAFEKMVSDYIYSGKPPLRDTVVNALNKKPKILERKSIIKRIINKLLEFIEKFDEGMGDI